MSRFCESQRGPIWYGLLMAMAFLLAFQNCARVQFSETNEPSLVVEGPSVLVVEEESIESTNGDAYSGKVTRYIRFDDEGVCGDATDVRDEIHEQEGDFYLVREDCQEVEDFKLEVADVERVSDEQIRYAEKTLERQFPSSCQEIYDLGGDEGNGYYTVDGDGPGGEDPQAVFCNMQLIELGQ